ncbi:hypothetical protein NGB36_10680 [Streptomyces sp. RB6PN25]|uniref:Lipoprotein n=1 Tax=Streptomyces humicola TaxID=2953240 RepID=A0ABT1PV71_9ACTN|nr:copper chaperone PCu(A)C [Streptomyces humicola]MCQ4081053.1 hypothetical protein [Streptomyces humicola]
MTRDSLLIRTIRAAAVSAVFAALATACSVSPSEPTAPTTSTSGSTSPASTPGRMDVTAPGIDLRLSDVTARLNASGTGEVTMTIRNDGSVPEHLDMIAAPGGSRATLQGGSAVDGSMTSAGILLQPGSTTTFGGHGPHVLFQDVHGTTAIHTLPLTLEFGVAGLVHVQAVVTTQSTTLP